MLQSIRAGTTMKQKIIDNRTQKIIIRLLLQE